MSLLMNYNDPKFLEVAQRIFDEQFKRDPLIDKEMNQRRKRLMYDDVIYNISFLMTAVHFDDESIFENYAVWIFELLCNLMKDLDRDRIMVQMTDHYKIMAELFETCAGDLLNSDEISKAVRILDKACMRTREAVTDVPLSIPFLEGKYADIRKSYLHALMMNQTKTAYDVISSARKAGIPIIDIYEKILAKVMHEVGELWHKHVITVDKEHYATSVTQTVMSMFYDEIFERPRINRTLVCCAIGSELHEMGARMLSDIFEYGGWDTYYLGAALPQEALIKSIEEYKPDLVALSVTMPPYLPACEDVIKALREKFPELKIAVGGRAFLSTSKLWEKWDLDYYAPSAGELLNWSRDNITKHISTKK